MRPATPARAGSPAATGCGPSTPTCPCCARPFWRAARATASSSTSAPPRARCSARATPAPAGSRPRPTCPRSTPYADCMAYTTAEGRQQLLGDLARAIEELNVGLAALGAAYEALDERSADRLEEQLFRPVQ